jgi:hypothetical protein
MPTDGPPALRKAASSRLWLAALFTLVAAMAVIGVIVLRSDSGPGTPVSTGPVPSDETTTSTTVSARGEVASRLREILRTRDVALLSRDASLLDEIYTIDCPCLKDGRTLIEQLRKENIVWKGVRTNIDITNMEEVNDRLWIVVATVRTPSVRIETESAQLIRTIPAERNRVRFALTRPQDAQEWLLGHASNLG